MPIQSHTLGPGLLVLGDGPLDVSAQLTACEVVPAEEVTSTDAISVLSGERLEGDEEVTFRYTLEGTFLQDLALAGVVSWSWANAGTPQAFRFVPDNAAARQVEGIVKPVPLRIGGDEVGARMTSDFTWRIVGTPDLEASA